MVWYSKEAISAESDWQLIAANELARNAFKKVVRRLSQRDFIAIFGVHPTTVSKLHYVYLCDCGSSLFQPKYLLWALSWMRSYQTEPNSSIPFADYNVRYFRDNV